MSTHSRAPHRMVLIPGAGLDRFTDAVIDPLE